MSGLSDKKILVVNTFGIGDVLFTTPLVKNIKRQIPDASLGYIVNARTVDIFKNYALIDQVFVYERDEFHDAYKRSKWRFLNKTKEFLNCVKAHHYDVVIDLSMNMPTGLLMKMAGIKERIGFDYKGRGKFLTTKIPIKGFERKHVVEYYLDLLREIGLEAEALPMDFPMDPSDEQWIQDTFDRHRFNGCVITIVPGGGASWGRDATRKQWAPQKFAGLADQLIENFSAKIILAGGPGDKPLSQKISGLIKNTVFDFTGELTLGQSAALFAKSHLVIANDGGPLHVAVAAGAKTVSIFGPVDQRVYGPYPAKGHRTVSLDIACRPCYRRFRLAQCDHISCLRDLQVDKVFNVVKEIL